MFITYQIKWCYLMFLLLLFQAVASELEYGSDNDGVSDQNQICKPLAEVQKELFSEEILKPNETLKLLERIESHRRKYDGQCDCIDWDHMVGKYIEASNLREDKCDIRTALDLSELTEVNMKLRGSPSIDMYIKYYANEQFKICKPKIDLMLARAIRSLSRRQKWEIHMLFGCIVCKRTTNCRWPIGRPAYPYNNELLNQFYEINAESFAGGLLLYMKESSADLRPPFSLFWKHATPAYSLRKSEWFNFKYTERVRSLCLSVINRFDRLARIYEPFIVDNMAAHNDLVVRGWVTLTRICRNIIINHSVVFTATKRVWSEEGIVKVLRGENN